MSLIGLLVTILILGLIYWAVLQLPLPPPFPVIVQVIFVIILILILVQFLGVYPIAGAAYLRRC